MKWGIRYARRKEINWRIDASRRDRLMRESFQLFQKQLATEAHLYAPRFIFNRMPKWNLTNLLLFMVTFSFSRDVWIERKIQNNYQTSIKHEFVCLRFVIPFRCSFFGFSIRVRIRIYCRVCVEFVYPNHFRRENWNSVYLPHIDTNNSKNVP